MSFCEVCWSVLFCVNQNLGDGLPYDCIQFLVASRLPCKWCYGVCWLWIYWQKCVPKRRRSYDLQRKIPNVRGVLAAMRRPKCNSHMCAESVQMCADRMREKQTCVHFCVGDGRWICNLCAKCLRKGPISEIWDIECAWMCAAVPHLKFRIACGMCADKLGTHPHILRLNSQCVLFRIAWPRANAPASWRH